MEKELSEDEQFNLFGCGPRCIIKLAELQGKPISRENFIKRFSNLFPPKHAGLTNSFEQMLMAKELDLCHSAVALRDKDYVIDEYVNHRTRGVFLLTDRNEKSECLFHCRLVLGVTANLVRLFSRCQSGSDFELDETWVDLEIQMPHFLVFR